MGERLSIYSTEPDKIRRVLQPAHEELTARGILLAVEVEGRGKAQNLTYVFSPVNQLPDQGCISEFRGRSGKSGVTAHFHAHQWAN